MIKLVLSLTAVMLVSLAAGCGWSPERSSDSQSTPSSSSRPSEPSAPPAKDPEADGSNGGDPRFVPPAKPCDAVTADDRAKLRLTKAKPEYVSLQKSCVLSNEPADSPPRQFRTLKVSYNTAPPALSDAVDYAKNDFARRMDADFQQPNPLGGPPTVKGALGQVGTSNAGQEFDEGYYVFYETAVAGSKEGNGLAVIRRGGVVITITASGNDIPGERVVESRPITNKTAQLMIDTVADHVIEAVEPAS